MPSHLNGEFFHDDTSAYSAYHIIVYVAIYSKFEEETLEKRKMTKSNKEIKISYFSMALRQQHPKQLKMN